MTEARLRELYQHALATRGPAAPGGAGRERCPSPEAMLALVRREGAEEERLATLDHVMSCDACRRELDLLRAIEMAGAGGAGGVGAGAAHSRDRPAATVVPWKRVVPLALAASLLLAVGVGVGIGVRDRFSAGDRGPDVVRGGGGEGGDLTLLAPAAGASVAAGAPLTFAWRPDPDARRYVVEVLDANDRAVVSDTTADTTLTLPDASRLAAGAEYRWWVRTAGGAGASQRASAVRPLAVRSQR